MRGGNRASQAALVLVGAVILYLASPRVAVSGYIALGKPRSALDVFAAICAPAEWLAGNSDAYGRYLDWCCRTKRDE
ncbi:hypothetical protein BH23VER1_BH23VER1_31170 [soil metagenome]